MNYLKDLFIDEAKKALLNKENGSGGVKINNQDKTITANGVYSADEGFTGLGNVYIDVDIAGDNALLYSIIDGSAEAIYCDVEKIGKGAFYSRSNLKSINLPNATIVESCAFQDCKALTEINLPLVKMNDWSTTSVFEGCSSLKTVTLPSVTGMMNSTFYDCKALEYVDLPEATSVDQYCFKNCTSLKGWNLPKLRSIGEQAFYSCKSIESVDFPNVTTLGSNVTYNKQQCFEYCTSLKTANFPKATNINYSVFEDCTALESVNFPSATVIAKNAFSGCKKLTTVNAPLVTSIAMQAFYNCISLQMLDVPLLTSINDTKSFYNCEAFTAFILRNTENVCTLANKNTFESTPIASGTGYIYVPSALIEQYKVATNWSTYAAQFRALEDYTVDGTVTGELDETKI